MTSKRTLSVCFVPSECFYLNIAVCNYARRWVFRNHKAYLYQSTLASGQVKGKGVVERQGGAE